MQHCFLSGTRNEELATLNLELSTLNFVLCTWNFEGDAQAGQPNKVQRTKYKAQRQNTSARYNPIVYEDHRINEASRQQGCDLANQ